MNRTLRTETGAVAPIVALIFMAAVVLVLATIASVLFFVVF